MEIIYLTALGIILPALLIIFITKKLELKISPFLIFAIVDILAGLLILGFAIYDFHTSVGEFAGILGQLALAIGEPVVGGLLIIDIIVWIVYKRKQKLVA